MKNIIIKLALGILSTTSLFANSDKKYLNASNDNRISGLTHSTDNAVCHLEDRLTFCNANLDIDLFAKNVLIYKFDDENKDSPKHFKCTISKDILKEKFIENQKAISNNFDITYRLNNNINLKNQSLGNNNQSIHANQHLYINTYSSEHVMKPNYGLKINF